LDTLVSAGGIGENAPEIRDRICDGLGFLGVELNETRNARNALLISPVAVRVLHTNEEWLIAKTGCGVLSIGPASEKKNSRRSPPWGCTLRRRNMKFGTGANVGKTDFTNTL
jgi:hypothetical protein